MPDELVGDLAVGQPGAPRTEVHLVHAHRRVVGRGLRTSFHPRGVTLRPRVLGGGDDRRGQRRDLGAAGERVRPLDPAGVGEDLELVALPDERARPEQLPDAEVVQATHRGGAALPTLEVADDPDRGRARCPHGEGDTVHTVDGADVGAEVLPELLVAALAEEVQVELADGRREAVRVVRGPRRVVGVGGLVEVVVGLDPVASERAGGGTCPHAVALVREFDVVAVRPDDPHGRCQVADDTDARAAVDRVRAQHVVRLGPAALGDLLAEPVLDRRRPRPVRRGGGRRGRARRLLRSGGGGPARPGVGRGRTRRRARPAAEGRGLGDATVGALTRGRRGARQVLTGGGDARLVPGRVVARGPVGSARRRCCGRRGVRHGRRGRRHGRDARPLTTARRDGCRSGVAHRLGPLRVAVGHRCGPSTTSRCTGSWKASRRT